MPTPAAPETRAALSATPAIEPTGAADVLAALSTPTLAVGHATRIMAAEMAAAHAVLDGYSVAPKDGTLATRIESLRKSGVDAVAAALSVLDPEVREQVLARLTGPVRQEVEADASLSDLGIGPTLAEVQERQRANEAIAQLHDAQRDLKAITAALDADPERSPAWDDNDQPIPLPRRVEVALMPGESQQVADLRASFRGIERQLGEVDAALHALGSYGLSSTKERLLQVLPVEDRRALLELDAAELRASLARLKARRLNPPPAERVAECRRELDIVEAKLCSLDHLPDAGKMVNA